MFSKSTVHFLVSLASLTMPACSGDGGAFEPVAESGSEIILQRKPSADIIVQADGSTDIIVQRKSDTTADIIVQGPAPAGDTNDVGCSERLLNRDFDLPSNQSEAEFLEPTFYSGDSAPFNLSLPFSVLNWHAGLSTNGNVPNPGNLSAYFRFLRDAPGPFVTKANVPPGVVLMSLSPGAQSTTLTQFFASYVPANVVEHESSISARVMLLSGSVKLALMDANGLSQCVVQTGPATVKGEWLDLGRACPAPAAGSTFNGIALGNVDDKGTVALIDHVSVCAH